ncbi:AAA family ATPase [Acinetobacter kookii]
MKFNKITLSEWRQFKNIDIDFHPKVTIITGTNGAGKSTILQILAEHYGWKLKYLSSPLEQNSGRYIYSSPIKKNYLNTVELGNIFYSDESIAALTIPSKNSSYEFNIDITKKKNVFGVFISSHRPVTYYHKVESLPTAPIYPSEAFNNYFQEYIKRFSVQKTISPFKYSPNYKMKEALISMAAFGSGNQYVEKNEILEETFNKFNDILKKVLPPNLGFKNLKVVMPDLIIESTTGSFLLDASSGGIMSIIDLAWQIFLYSDDKDEFVVTIDEPENHLHPSMQRSLLNDFVEAFPKAQFIVVTHSPFVVSSIRDSNVYALKYEDFQDSDNPDKIVKKVISQKLDLNKKAATANEILREVLGVPVTLPQWAEDDLQRICSSFNAVDITPDGLARLHTELEQAGLGEFYPEALNKVVESNFHD